MILLALTYSLQYFITGTNTWPGIVVFLIITVGAFMETLVEIKILGAKE